MLISRNMKNKRLISLISTILTMLLLLSGCGGIKKLQDIRLTSAAIGNISPSGLRGMKLDIVVGVDNPGTEVSFSDISCSLKHSGKVLGKLAVDPFTLHARTEENYRLHTDVKLGDDVTLFDFGKLLDKAMLDEAVVDINAKVKLKSGVSRNVVLKDIPLKKLLETARK